MLVAVIALALGLLPPRAASAATCQLGTPDGGIVLYSGGPTGTLVGAAVFDTISCSAPQVVTLTLAMAATGVAESLDSVHVRSYACYTPCSEIFGSVYVTGYRVPFTPLCVRGIVYALWEGRQHASRQFKDGC